MVRAIEFLILANISLVSYGRLLRVLHAFFIVFVVFDGKKPGEHILPGQCYYN